MGSFGKVVTLVESDSKQVELWLGALGTIAIGAFYVFGAVEPPSFLEHVEQPVLSPIQIWNWDKQ